MLASFSWLTGAFFFTAAIAATASVPASWEPRGIGGGAHFGISNVTGIPAGEAIFSFAGAKQGGVIKLFCLTL